MKLVIRMDNRLFFRRLKRCIRNYLIRLCKKSFILLTDENNKILFIFFIGLKNHNIGTK
ncbi:hypothetical protein HMPREF9413_3292 [Paenibacillus sp. HGF7]|nr:hypothetical protein HMPREF9413_3292 [Paenibacillus sp. HGF7]